MSSEPFPITNYIIRTYREGDEIELIRIFKKCYQNYAGLISQTIDDWIWNRILRPDIDSKGIFVMETANKIVGYVVVSEKGEIYELGYDPDYRSQKIVLKLIKRAIQYVKKISGNTIAFRAPREDIIIREVCELLDFYERPLSTVLVFNVLNFQAFLEKIFENKKSMPLNNNENVLLQISDAPTPDKSLTISLRNDNIVVERKKISKPKFTIDTDSTTITCLILGTYSIRKAIIRFRLKIKPFWRILTAINFLKILVQKDPWHMPRVY